MATTLMTAVLIAAAWQNPLTPTDITAGGELTESFRTRVQAFSATLSGGGFDIDIDQTQFLGVFEMSAGLGHGFEAELTLPILFTGGAEGDGTSVFGPTEISIDQGGIGDLTLVGNYRLMKEADGSPHWIAGLIVTLPTGDDDPGSLGSKISGVPFTEREKAGFGDGTTKFGAATGASKRFGQAEPYVMLSYLVAGTREVDNIETDLADRLTLTLGSEFDAGPGFTLDVRTTIEYRSEEEGEDNAGVPETEEAHMNVQADVRGYIDLGYGFTLVAGAGIIWGQDHETEEETGEEIESLFGFGGEIGIHVSLAPRDRR